MQCIKLERIVRDNLVNHTKKYKNFSDSVVLYQEGQQFHNFWVDKWIAIFVLGGYVNVAYNNFMKAFNMVSKA